MIEGLRDIIQREVERALRRRGWPRIGVVDGYDPNRHAVKVKFEDEDKLSNWVPIGSAWTGNGWGLHMAPVIGSQVVVSYHDGDSNTGFVSHQLFSKIDNPLSVPSGDMWLQHENGCAFKLHANGLLELISGNVQIGVSGATFHQLVHDGLVALFNGHTHSGVQAGSAVSGAPVQKLSQAELSQNVKVS
jgi:phage baseplate assembly protein gpV